VLAFGGAQPGLNLAADLARGKVDRVDVRIGGVGLEGSPGARGRKIGAQWGVRIYCAGAQCGAGAMGYRRWPQGFTAQRPNVELGQWVTMGDRGTRRAGVCGTAGDAASLRRGFIKPVEPPAPGFSISTGSVRAGVERPDRRGSAPRPSPAH
jgi:hypothetical protein